jgi:hypothetical protein
MAAIRDEFEEEEGDEEEGEEEEGGLGSEDAAAATGREAVDGAAAPVASSRPMMGGGDGTRAGA